MNLVCILLMKKESTQMVTMANIIDEIYEILGDSFTESREAIIPEYHKWWLPFQISSHLVIFIRKK